MPTQMFADLIAGHHGMAHIANQRPVTDASLNQALCGRPIARQTLDIEMDQDCDGPQP